MADVVFGRGPRRARATLRWSVVVASPKGSAGDQWGDTWFGEDLAAALRRAGQRARVVRRANATAPARDEDDVVLVLRGLRRVVPRRDSASRRHGPLWLLWVISHPELVEPDEPGQYDATFAASAHWSRSTEFGVPVTPLLQATDPGRFTPAAGAPDTGASVLFVGSTRGEFRPVVRDALAAGVPVTVYGVGWADLVPVDRIAGEFLANADLPAAYARAGVVLNDHWPDMAREGFVSNRLFDAAATATRVLSDAAVGLAEVFGDVVATYEGPADLATRLNGDVDVAFAPRVRRIELAERIAREHSFDARAAELIARAKQLRSRR